MYHGQLVCGVVLKILKYCEGGLDALESSCVWKTESWLFYANKFHESPNWIYDLENKTKLVSAFLSLQILMESKV